MAERREYQGAAVVTKLATDITSSVLALTINSVTGWPTGSVGPFTIVIDPGTSTEEKLKCIARSGATITVAAGGRGADGTSAVNHKANAVVKHVLGAYDIDLVNRHAADTTQDDHTQYVHNTVARTVSANHTFSGAPVFSGNPSFTNNPVFGGTPHFTGTPTFDNMGTAFDVSTIDTSSGGAGTSPKPARADHKHPLNLNLLRDYFTPAGVIVMTGSNSTPPGWAFCNGQALSRTAFPNLFAAIGTTYGAGDGTTTFNVPNFIGRVPVMPGDASHPNLANAGGQVQQTLNTGNMPAHNHGVNDPGHNHSVNFNDPGHRHGFGGDQGFRIGVSFGGSSYGFQTSSNDQRMTLTNMDVVGTGISVSNNGNTTGITTQNNGSGSSFSVEQPWLGVNFMIKVS